MTAPDLKPCPFCGGDVFHIQSWEGDSHDVGCFNSECPIKPNAWAETEDEAIAAWNTRAVDPAAIREAMADRIEQLVKERDEAERNETLCSNMAVNYLERAEVAESKLDKAVEFIQEVRRNGNTRLASMAIAVLIELEKTE